MAVTLKLEIVTPHAKTYSEDVDMVTLPGVEGEMGIYPNHVPLMTQVSCGEVIARQDGKDTYLAIGDGFVEITGERVAILTDMAVKSEDIDEAAAEKARKKAEERLTEGNLSDEQMAAENAVIAQAAAQLELKRKRRK